MKSIKIWNDEISLQQARELAELLRQGCLMIAPTDTLYAICCDALNRKAIEALCRIKGINPDKSNLSVICSDLSMAAEYARFDNAAFRLIKENTPGAFTFLCKAASSLPAEFKRRKIVGIRIPDSQAVREIAKALGNPLLTTSIQFDDDDYARNPELIAENYEGRVDLILSGEDGDTEPSTIIDCTGREPEIIREGKGIPA